MVDTFFPKFFSISSSELSFSATLVYRSMAITPSRFSPISLTAICAVCRLSSMGFIPNTSRCIRSFSRAVFRCLKMFFSSSLFSMPCAFSRSPRIMFTMSFLSFLVKNSFSAISFLYVKGIAACWRLPLMNLSLNVRLWLVFHVSACVPACLLTG